MENNIEVQFADGETVVVFLGLDSEADIDLVLTAWAILYQRQIQSWKATSAPAQYFYDAAQKHINRYDCRGYHDELVDVLQIAKLRKDLGKPPPSR